METTLTKVEMITDFAAYLESAIKFVTENDGIGRETSTRDTVELSPGVLETMKDIMVDVREVMNRFRPPTKDDTVYERHHDAL